MKLTLIDAQRAFEVSQLLNGAFTKCAQWAIFPIHYVGLFPESEYGNYHMVYILFWEKVSKELIIPHCGHCVGQALVRASMQLSQYIREILLKKVVGLAVSISN